MLGEHDMTELGEEVLTRTVKKVKRFILHEDFDYPFKFDNDVALILLSNKDLIFCKMTKQIIWYKKFVI